MFTLQNNLSDSSENDRYKAVDTEKIYYRIFRGKLWQKLAKHFKSIGVQAAYKVLQLFYVTQNPNVPRRLRLEYMGH